MYLIDELPTEVIVELAEYLDCEDTKALSKSSERGRAVLTEILIEKGDKAAGFCKDEIKAEGTLFYGKPCECKLCPTCQEAADTKKKYKELIMRYRTYFSMN